ncbi:ATP synthase subunit delta [Alphaproteobacteria bacterium]|nr:ATP synthase subunit delta [Alphaproteobacteria bacterium]
MPGQGVRAQCGSFQVSFACSIVGSSPLSSGNHGAIADRYSRALFELADEGGSLDVVADDLKSLQAMTEASADLRNMLKSPAIGRGVQQNAILAVAEKSDFSPLTKNFLGLLARNRRLFAVDSITLAYFERLAKKRGRVSAELVSAIALTPEQVGEVTSLLKKNVGGEIDLNAKVDSSLLGGLVLRVGSRLIDNSLKTKLQHLKLAMKGIG